MFVDEAAYDGLRERRSQFPVANVNLRLRVPGKLTSARGRDSAF